MTVKVGTKPHAPMARWLLEDKALKLGFSSNYIDELSDTELQKMVLKKWCQESEMSREEK
ncbi:hypothetical protein NVP1170O_141 [Vibrio phage 1.170.O._10N.261.52.C3]|nr:hypothetical protein NVP1170O_141 [Vibrio phage 1.170.O._10N.261.52.C3]